jgi:hypothetical protein
MALPANFGAGTVTAKYTKLDGVADTGTVIFRAAPAILLDPGNAPKTIVTPIDIVATLDVNGAISVTLPATNDPDISPFSWTYSVIETLASGKGRTMTGLSVGLGTSQDLVDFVSVATVGGVSATTSIVHNWDVDGWTPWVARPISADTGATQTLSVSGSKGRCTGQASSSFGNRRDAYLRNGTEWADSRITALVIGGNIYNSSTATPQIGFVHRGQIVAGVFNGLVTTNNIFLTDPNQHNFNLWSSNVGGTVLTLGDVGGTKDFGGVLNRTCALTGSERFNFGGWINNQAFVPNHLYGAAVGDVVDIESTDSTFTTTGVALTGADTIAGRVTHTEPTTLSTVAWKADSGKLIPPIPKRYWPLWICSELRGNLHRIKVWRYQDPEPDWSSAANVNIGYDINSATNLPDLTGSGFCGVVFAHLRSSCTADIAYLRFDQL